MQSVTQPGRNVPMTPFLNQFKPWVSVICTSYNHEAYVVDALRSVVAQDYPNVELIVIDNGSTDQTPARIADFVAEHPAVHYVRNAQNMGLCRAFNQGLSAAGGHYVIDLSADDLLLPGRISRQVEAFERLPANYAVVFSNAHYVDAAGRLLGYHYPVDAAGHARQPVPSGDVFGNVLASYFICTPTMMMRRSVLDELGGYDETLAYEDFDFWVRSARTYAYAYIDQVLTAKRQLTTSLSAQVLRPDNQLLESTLAVCYKAFDRCQTPAEYEALAQRVRQYVRRAFYTEQFELAQRFGRLLRFLERPDLLTYGILGLSQLRLPVNGLYQRYVRWRNHSLPLLVNQ